ncbi:LacI family DNA-binding transcriptional regulator [Clostridium sp.]|uniref:LacI family DNA-binding transcriptional regulator n=1 Tax=Clostridium sp. TaxID=1506 RepID=UPI001A59C9DB|nr:LacI family DNA-binding transcriptional regulator [Clostridium sp.]MBK5234708.1 LacI family DNA-binding transcriptional regulator [Clostridium sp.]
MATIKDVARESGVTVTTVSRVLNNRGYISDATRKKVNEAIEALHYQPNELARSLFRKKSNFIGLIVPNVAHPFFAELTRFIEYYAYKEEYKVLICNSYQDTIKEREYVEMLKRNQVDGIIMGSHTLETSDYLVPTLPIVAIDRNFSQGIPYVTSDNYNGGVLATNLLIDKGCKKIVHISGPLELNTPANNRYKAFMDIVKKRNVEYVIVEAKLDIFESYEKLAYKLFAEEPDIDGVFASSDMIAASILHVANEIGKEIPKDLKIIGYDDINIARMIIPPLTTIKQPIEKMAELAVSLLINQIKHNEVKLENVLPISLVERKTT